MAKFCGLLYGGGYKLAPDHTTLVTGYIFAHLRRIAFQFDSLLISRHPFQWCDEGFSQTGSCQRVYLVKGDVRVNRSVSLNSPLLTTSDFVAFHSNTLLIKQEIKLQVLNRRNAWFLAWCRLS